MIRGGPSVLAIAKGKKLMPCTEDLRCIHAILRRHLRRRQRPADATPRLTWQAWRPLAAATAAGISLSLLTD